MILRLEETTLGKLEPGDLFTRYKSALWEPFNPDWHVDMRVCVRCGAPIPQRRRGDLVCKVTFILDDEKE